MQLEGYKQAGLTFTAEDIDMMIWAIRLLGVLHGIALVLDFVGDQMIAAFKGVPVQGTVFDRRQEARKYQQTEMKMRYPYLPGREPTTQPLPFPIEKDEPTPARPPFHSPSE